MRKPPRSGPGRRAAPAAEDGGCLERAAPLTGVAAGVPCPPLAGTTAPPVAAAPREARRLAVVLGGLFALAGSGSSAAAVALPALGADLGVSREATAWALTVYVLALAVTTAVYGRLADLVGVRRPLLAGGGLMAAGAVIAAVAPDLPLLLVGRLVQGAGAGAIPVLATALVTGRFSGQVRAAALARVAGLAAAGGALGPLAGGLLESALGWRAVLALPAAGLLLLPLVVRSAGRRGSGGRLDGLGAVLVVAVAAGAVLLVQSAASGLPLAVAGGALLLVSGPLAVVHVRRRPDGFLPRQVIGSGRLVLAAICASVVPAGWFGLLLAVPADLADRGWSALLIGAVLVPAAGVGLLASRYVGRVLARVGAVAVLAVATVLTAAALSVAALGVVVGAAPLLAAAVAIVAAAFSWGQPALVQVVSAAVAPADRGVALGVATLLFLLGGGIGTAIVAGVGAAATPAVALVVLAALPAGASVLAGRLRSDRPSPA